MKLPKLFRNIFTRESDLPVQTESAKTTPFPEAVHEAHLLLYFASRRGIRLEGPIIKNAVEAAYLEHGDARNIETQKKVEQLFWAAFQQLAEAVKPVTIESIKATHDSRLTGVSTPGFLFGTRSLARRSVLKYSAFAIVTLLLVIAIQMYWVIGVSITNEAVSLQNELDGIREEMKRIRDEPNDTLLAENSRYSELESQTTERRNWLQATFGNLRSWNRLWQETATFLKLIQRPSEIVAATSDGPSRSNESSGAEMADNRIAFTSAGFVLQALSTYAIPLLYGLLGALAYVLRELAKEVRLVTFSHASRIRYSLRIALGLLAGIAVGFLVSPDAVQGTQSILTASTLGPIALAFLAGYSVELVFAVMDRIVSAFSDDRRQRTTNGLAHPPR